MKKKIIIVTLGPSSLNKNAVNKMDRLGVDIFRINLSHVYINELEKTIKKVKQWTDKPVCLDTEGAQLRTGKIESKVIRLETGKTIKFTNSDDATDVEELNLSDDLDELTASEGSDISLEEEEPTNYSFEKTYEKNSDDELDANIPLNIQDVNEVDNEKGGSQDPGNVDVKVIKLNHT